jgi:ABC-2 type transport system ATP-binding protein
MQISQTATQQIQKHGLTVIYTSHNMADVEALCQRILFLHKGRIIASGTPQEIVKNLDAESLEEVFIGIARDQFDPLLLHQPGAGNGGVA